MNVFLPGHFLPKLLPHPLINSISQTTSQYSPHLLLEDELISRTQLSLSITKMPPNRLRLNDTIIPSLDGQHHSPDDGCHPDAPSHSAYVRTLSDRQVNYLNSLSSDQQARVLGVVGLTSAQRVKSILLNNSIHQPGLFLSKAEIAIGVKDCYDAIAAGRIDVYDIFAVIEGILDRTKEDAIVKGEGIEGGVQQLLFLASRMVKGEACEECEVGVISCWTSVHFDFIDALVEIEEFATKHDLKFQLDTKAEFALDKLCKIFEGISLGRGYSTFRYLIQGGLENTQQLEEMWCNEDNSCICWDTTVGDHHGIMCELNGL